MEQRDISLSYGIHRSPSIGNEGELSECVNLIPKNGELVNIQPPKAIGINLPDGSTLLYVHRTKEFVHYIFFQTNVLRYANEDGTTQLLGGTQYEEIPRSITSVGNTLIVITDNPIRYLLWQDGFYKELGEKPPFPSISFGLTGSFEKTDQQSVTIDHSEGDFTEDQLSAITNSVMGYVSKFIRERSVERGRFIYPFFIRYAYRLYDGTSYMQSAPILMIPSSGVNPHVPYTFIGTDMEGSDMKLIVGFIVSAVTCQIDYRVSGMGSQRLWWKDIVKSLDIFITPPIYTFDYYGEIKGTQSISSDNGFGVYSFGGGSYTRRTFYEALSTSMPGSGYSQQFVLPGNEMDNNVPDNSLFYKVASISYEDLCDYNGGGRRSLALEDNVLDNLQGREQLVDADGYQNLDSLIPDYAYIYNQRLNIANIRRVLFDGYTPESMVAYNDGSSSLSAKVFIREGDREIVTRTSSSYSLGINLHYAFYPNANAYKMVITRDSDGYQVVLPLTPHNRLNGSYYFSSYAPVIFRPGGDNTPVSTDKSVSMPNKIYTSEVNNPFYFPLAGINTVGTGEIIGIRSTTKALSQGQFGQFPLYAFSSDGIWALRLSDTGLYSSVQPVSRDVCDNPDSITQIDSAIVFSTERGLKLLQGSDITLLSSKMEGVNINESYFNVNHGFSHLFIPDTETFIETLRTCKIAYDYTNSLIHIYPRSNSKHYVYSLDTGEFSTFVGGEVKAIGQDYPSTVVQIGNSLYSLERYVSDETRKGIAITRKLEFGDPFSLKALVDLRTLGLRNNDSSMIKIAVFVSEDGKRWSRLNSLRQRAFKYYRFVYFSELSDLDTLSGTRVLFETRRNNKLR